MKKPPNQCMALPKRQPFRAGSSNTLVAWTRRSKQTKQRLKLYTTTIRDEKSFGFFWYFVPHLPLQSME